jgi:hypothetical protein
MLSARRSVDLTAVDWKGLKSWEGCSMLYRKANVCPALLRRTWLLTTKLTRHPHKDATCAAHVLLSFEAS